MKNIKVCALLCAVALSANIVLPVMAAENTDNIYTTEDGAMVEENQIAEPQGDAVTGNDTEGIEEQEQAGENANDVEQQESPQETAQDEVKTEDSQVVSEEDEAEADKQNQDGIPENGWYTDENRNTYYYENGVKIVNLIKKIADADGNTYGYYFGFDGVLQKNNRIHVSYILSDLSYVNGYVRADEKGRLYQNRWYGKEEFYGDDYVTPAGKMIEYEGKLYYFDAGSTLFVNGRIMIEDVLYQADGNGVLTKVSIDKETKWELAGGYWYYYENGVVVKNTFKKIGNSTYFFDETGKMKTGAFWIDRKGYLAEADGSIVNCKNSWYYMKSNQKWYYFDENGSFVADKIINLDGVEYYLSYNGELQTGSFRYWDDEKHSFVNAYADATGVIYRVPGWHQSSGKWFYIQEDGQCVSDGIYTINGKRYFMDDTGIMQVGLINYRNSLSGMEYHLFTDASGALAEKAQWVLSNNKWYYAQAGGEIVRSQTIEIEGEQYSFDYDGQMRTGMIWDNGEKYYAQSDGVIAKNKWVKDGFGWYYAGKDGQLLTSQWIGNCYLGEDGTMAVGIIETKDGTYLFDDNGYKVTEIGTVSGWQLLDGTWYYYDAPGKPHNGWLESKYYIDNGRMATEEVVSSMGDTNRKAYVGVDGVIIQNGWIYDRYENCWYYSKNGMLAEDGWETIKGKKYYFNEIYLNRFAITEIGGKLYEFDGNGACQSEIKKKNSWYQSSDGTWYWFNEDGTLNTDEKKVIGKQTYYFWSSGEMISNAALYDGETHTYRWIHRDGYLDTTDGWKHSEDGEWCYQENGKLVNGKKVVNGVEYRFSPWMSSETIGFDDGSYVYYDENGVRTVLINGWYRLKEYGTYSWYYFVNGIPASGWMNGYYFDGRGRMCDSRARDNWWNLYMFDENGHLVKNQWTFRWGNWYYASASGRLYTGERTINGAKYWFGEDGVWIK